MDQHPTSDDHELRALLRSVPLADPQVTVVIDELSAEVARLRTDSTPTGPGDASSGAERLADLLLEQAAELLAERRRLQRVAALIDLSEWAAGADDGLDPTIRVSDLRRALADPTD